MSSWARAACGQRQDLGDPRAQAAGLEVGGQGAQLLGVGLHEDGLEADVARRLGGLGGRVKTAIPPSRRAAVGPSGPSGTASRTASTGPMVARSVERGTTSVAPSEATHSSSSWEAWASTRQPARAASCVAKPPTAPLAPVISSVAPAGAAMRSRACWAVSALSGSVAAVGVVDVRGQRGEPAGVDGGGLRVGADAPADAPEGDHPEHAVAGGEAVRLAPHRGHLAGEVPARHERRLQLGEPPARLARADAQVGRVDVGRADAHDDLARRRRGVGALGDPQDLGAAEGGDLCDVHAWKDP